MPVFAPVLSPDEDELIMEELSTVAEAAIAAVSVAVMDCEIKVDIDVVADDEDVELQVLLNLPGS
jgi:hypothetical protein